MYDGWKTGCIVDSSYYIVDPIKAHHATMLQVRRSVCDVPARNFCNLIITKVPPRPSIQKILNKYILKIYIMYFLQRPTHQPHLEVISQNKGQYLLLKSVRFLTNHEISKFNVWHGTGVYGHYFIRYWHIGDPFLVDFFWSLVYLPGTS